MIDWIKSLFASKEAGTTGQTAGNPDPLLDWHVVREQAKTLRDLFLANAQQQQPDFMSNNVPGQAVPQWERKSKLRQIVLPSQRY